VAAREALVERHRERQAEGVGRLKGTLGRGR
jgi:hypothetical protein